MANGQKTQDNYTNPRGTVYITEGNVRVLLAISHFPIDHSILHTMRA